MKKAWLLTVPLASLVLAPAASAHGRTGLARGYVSTFVQLRPNVLGLTVTIADGDDRILLRNWSGKPVVVLGYQGEPYLRFGAKSGVWENVRSAAVYLNRDRYGHVSVPASAAPNARPQWRRVSSGNSLGWHDHRIHWMSRVPPPAVRRAPDQAHKIFDWKVPAQASGRPFAIEGFLGYVPPAGRPDGGSTPWTLFVVAALVGVGGLALGGALVSRRASPAVPPPTETSGGPAAARGSSDGGSSGSPS